MNPGRVTKKARVFVPCETSNSWYEIFSNLLGFRDFKEGENVIGFAKGRDATKVKTIG